MTAVVSLADRIAAGKRDNVLASHPRMENRIRALEKLSRTMGLGGFTTAGGAAGPTNVTAVESRR